jgi:hypothetical protein
MRTGTECTGHAQRRLDVEHARAALLVGSDRAAARDEHGLELGHAEGPRRALDGDLAGVVVDGNLTFRVGVDRRVKRRVGDLDERERRVGGVAAEDIGEARGNDGVDVAALERLGGCARRLDERLRQNAPV